MEGGTKAAKEIADRIEGKPPQRMEITGPVHKEVTIRVVHDQTRYMSQRVGVNKSEPTGAEVGFPRLSDPCRGTEERPGLSSVPAASALGVRSTPGS